MITFGGLKILPCTFPDTNVINELLSNVRVWSALFAIVVDSIFEEDIFDTLELQTASTHRN